MKILAPGFVMLSCMACAAVAAPFLAIGDNAELFLTGSVGVRYDDNILLAPDSLKKDDVIAQFVPGLALEFGKNSLIKGSFTAHETLNDYADNSQLNTQLGAVAFDSSYDNGKLKLGTNASYTQLDQNTYAANGTNQRRDTTNAGVNGELSISDKTSVGTGFSYYEVNYKKNAGVDETEYTVPLNLYYGLTPKTDISGGVTYTRTDLDNGTNYDTFYYNVGARGEFTPKLTGSFSVGYNDRYGHGLGSTSDGGLGVKSALAYAYSEKTQFSFDASRDFGNNGTTGASQEQTQVTLGARTDLTVNWQANASLTYRLIDYKIPGSPVADYYEVSVGATYVISSIFSANASYLFRGNQSDIAGQGFTDNVVALSFSARY